jgi:hypothetical protein
LTCLRNIIRLGILSLAITGCEKYEEFGFTSLEFPFLHAEDIERIAAFGIPNWSDTEPHNGIDLIVNQNLEKSTVVSPVKGTVKSIRMSENPFSNPINQLILTVEIYVNKEWTVNLVIEPSASDEATKTTQRNALKVKEGDVVDVWQEIGDLIVGEYGYAHLHFMVLKNDDPVCAYNYSSDDAKEFYENIAERNDSELCIN